MILCIGEILADLIGEEKDGVFSYRRKAGGAPFNVACACGNSARRVFSAAAWERTRSAIF